MAFKRSGSLNMKELGTTINKCGSCEAEFALIKLIVDKQGKRKVIFVHPHTVPSFCPFCGWVK